LKKFKALWFVTAIIAVMAVASMASATTFVGVDQKGNIEKITVNPNDTTDKLIWEKLPGTSAITAPQFDKGGALIGHKFFSYDGGIVAVSADVAARKSLSTSDDVVLFKVADDGTVSFVKNLAVAGISSGDRSPANTAYSGVKQVVGFNGAPVFISDQVISTILNNTDFVRIELSVDAAFVVNNKLYTITSADGDAGDKGHAKYTKHMLRQVSAFTTTTTDIDTTMSYMKGDTITWPNAVYPGAFATAITGNYVYIANETGLFKFEAKETSDTGIILTGAAPKVEKTSLTGKYLAMTADNDTLYALKEKDGKILLMSISTEDDTETPLCETVSEDVKGLTLAKGANSFDVYYDPTDKVFAVVNHGVDTAFYIPDGTTYKLLTKSDVFPSLAMVKTASSSTDDGKDTETKTSTLVDPTKVDADKIAKVFDGKTASDFLTTETAGEATATTDKNDKAATTIAKEMDWEGATVTPVANFTPTKAGPVLVNAKYDAAKYVVYFIESTLLAADTPVKAKLLDDNLVEITSKTSTYAAAELESGKTYTMYAAQEKPSSTDDDNNKTTTSSGSSSSGCNAGFAAVSALLALAFFKKSR